MSDTAVTKKAAVFLVLTFAVSWISLIFSWLSGRRDIPSAQIAFFIAVLGPPLAAVTCSLAFDRGARLEALGLRFRLNAWCLWALLIAIALATLNVAVTATFSTHGLVGVEGMLRQLADLRHQEYSGTQSDLVMMAGYVGLTLLGNIILYTFTEEIGWRGYLYHLWRPFGFWRTSIATGLIWGVWHWPMIYLFGLNYPDHRLIGLAIFPVSTVLMATIMTLVRDRGRSILPTGILHAGLNTLAPLTIAAVDHPVFPWDAVGIGFFAALAIGALIVAVFQRGSGSV
jgi:membrane protease YdiL (CAAX protease family)